MPGLAAGSGQQNSLAQYLALQLSRGMKAGQITAIEGALLTAHGICELTFRCGEETLRSPAQAAGYDLSMFRLRGSL